MDCCFASKIGDWDFCTEKIPCMENEGDCDFDNQCQEDLICGTDNCPEEINIGIDCCFNSSKSNFTTISNMTETRAFLSFIGDFRVTSENYTESLQETSNPEYIAKANMYESMVST